MMVKSFLRSALSHPLTRGLDLDSPEATLRRRTLLLFRNSHHFIIFFQEEWAFAHLHPAGCIRIVEQWNALRSHG